MSSSPAAPGLGDLLEPTALHRLPKTRAPLCGYSRGLHAPNERCKSSLKEPFWFLSKKSGLALTWSSPEGVLQLSDARQFDVPECGHSPVLTPQLHRAPQSSWLTHTTQTVQRGLAKVTFLMPDAGVCSSQHCALEVNAASTSSISTSRTGKPISVILIITTQVTPRTRGDELFFTSVSFVLDKWELIT